MRRTTRAAALAFLLPICALLPALAARKELDPPSSVAPGPMEISAEERALEGAAGAEHAIVLLEETDWDELQGTDSETRYHLRAKILSNEGRALADVVIPYLKRDGKLKTWWGRTLLPDGTVLELPRERLVEGTLVKSGREEVRALRAALPGVVPGSVIDYGYTLREGGLALVRRVSLQRDHPIRELRIRWRPAQRLRHAYRVYNSAGLKVEAARQARAFEVTAHDLPAFVPEPSMPPAFYSQASVTFYYTWSSAGPEGFWDEQARWIGGAVSHFLSEDRPIRDRVEAWKLPPDSPLPDKLAHAYRWLTDHVRSTGARSFEELARTDAPEEVRRNKPGEVLAAGEGNGFQLAALYAGFARALGAEAHVAVVPDRREMVWDTALLSMQPFQHVLVAVGPPGAADDGFVFVDPGSGLEYGEVPWWTAGIKAMLATDRGSRAVLVPPPDPSKNVSDTDATVTFQDDGTARVTWTRTARNQRGFEPRRQLRELDPHARGERLLYLCGRGPEIEVVSAEAPGLEQRFGTLQLACAAEWALPAPSEDGPHTYSLVLEGPWIEPVPDFGGRTTRRYPVVFDHGRVDATRITVTAPPRYAPTEQTPPTPLLDTSFGRYTRAITRSGEGYVVERSFTLTALSVPPSQYADLRAFLDEVRRADRVPLEFVREGRAE